MIYNAASSPNWPTTEATITYSEVSEHMSGRRWRRHREYTPIVEYEYEVEGIIYDNDSISFNSLSSRDEDEAYAISSSYVEGKAYTVYYKPSNPAVSVLQPGASGGLYFYLLLPIICLSGPFLAYRQGMAFFYRINADVHALRARRYRD